MRDYLFQNDSSGITQLFEGYTIHPRFAPSIKAI
jgi:hypothetical protein